MVFKYAVRIRSFVPVLLELVGEHRLLELARDGAVCAGQLVLHELLRDRRAALHGRLVLDVCEKRARHAAKVDAPVLEEALVLRRDDRLLHPGGDVRALHEHAALSTAEHGEDRVAVGGVDVAVDLLLRRLLQRVEAAQLRVDGDDESEGERRHAQHGKHGHQGEKTELANPAPRPALARRLGAFSAEQHGSRRIVPPSRLRFGR